MEQTRSPVAGTVLYKVKASSSVDQSPGEPFALAARTTPTALVSPQPNVTLSSSTATAAPGEPVTITATLANPSGDLEGEDASVTLDVPPGVELLTGESTQHLGTLTTLGQPGNTATATWTVSSTGDGSHDLTARAEASKYGESFRGEAQITFAGQTPMTEGAAPPPPPAALTPPPPPVPPAASRPPKKPSGLALSRVRVLRRVLDVRGRVDATASGYVGLVYRLRLHGRTVTVSRRVAVTAGHFRGRLRLPRGSTRRGSLVASYAGDPNHLAARLRRTVRR